MPRRRRASDGAASCASRSRDTGIGIARRGAGAAVRAVHAGRRVDDAPLRRHRPRAGDLAAARRADGRRRSASTSAPGRGSTFWFDAAPRPRRDGRRGRRDELPTLAGAARPRRRRQRHQPRDPRSASSLVAASAASAADGAERAGAAARGAERRRAVRRRRCSTCNMPDDRRARARAADPRDARRCAAPRLVMLSSSGGAPRGRRASAGIDALPAASRSAASRLYEAIADAARGGARPRDRRAAAAAETPPRPRRRRVLVVEDNAINQLRGRGDAASARLSRSTSPRTGARRVERSPRRPYARC